jgi:hypothetical protein
MEQLPEFCDLNTLTVTIGGVPGRACYIGPREADGVQQLNVIMPPIPETRLVPLELWWRGDRLCPGAYLRVIPPPPVVPRLVSVSDGVNLMSGTCIASGMVKVTIEEISTPENFRAWIDGLEVSDVDSFCVDPLPPRWEINFQVPKQLAAGIHRLEMKLGFKRLGDVTVTIPSS